VDVRFCLVSAGPDQERCVWPDGYDSKLTVVIGGEAKDITTAEAAAHIFGYVCLNDVSDRATQVDAEGQQHLARAKSRPTYCPIGPYLTTDVDGMNLNMWAKLNGQFEQQGNTNDMLFNIDEMVAYFSTPMILFPGDLLATGTPPGVGFGKNRFMAIGDVLECGIEHLGAQRREIQA
jgi:2-keto-4-pentenoate hydratase/2-oxohepta-3-ene-1,7-dioic acid hydratase in catechol pathway